MTYKQERQLGCDLFAAVMKRDYDVEEVTTGIQKSNGTRMFQIPTGEEFGVYKSGMVRKIIRSISGGMHTCYQLNRQFQQHSRTMFLSNDGTFRTNKYNGTARIPIHTELARLVYLLDYVKKNYNVKEKTPGFVIVNGVKYIRSEEIV